MGGCCGRAKSQEDSSYYTHDAGAIHGRYDVSLPQKTIALHFGYYNVDRPPTGAKVPEGGTKRSTATRTVCSKHYATVLGEATWVKIRGATASAFTHGRDAVAPRSNYGQQPCATSVHPVQAPCISTNRPPRGQALVGMGHPGGMRLRRRQVPGREGITIAFCVYSWSGHPVGCGAGPREVDKLAQVHRTRTLAHRLHRRYVFFRRLRW